MSSQHERNWNAFDWEDIVPRLLLYAKIEISKKTWRGRFNDAVPGGLEAADFVYSAIEKTIRGRRKWKMEKGVSLIHHLMMAIRGEIGHVVRRVENQDARIDFIEDIERQLHSLEPVEPPDLSMEKKEEISSFLQHLKLLSDEAVIVAIARLKGFDPSEIAQALGLDVKEVYRVLERIAQSANKYGLRDDR